MNNKLIKNKKNIVFAIFFLIELEELEHIIPLEENLKKKTDMVIYYGIGNKIMNFFYGFSNNQITKYNSKLQ